MLQVVLALLIVLWFLGYVHLPYIPIPVVPLFGLGNRVVTLYDVLIFLLIIMVVEVLPSPFKQIAGVMLILWLLSLVGLLVIANLSSMLVLAIIVGLIAYLLGWKH